MNKEENNGTYDRGSTEIFQKTRSYIKILWARKMTYSKFDTEDDKYQAPPYTHYSPTRTAARNLLTPDLYISKTLLGSIPK